MAGLHDKSRRTLVLTLFIVLGVLPALAVFTWAMSRQTSAHARAIAREISNRLGLRVSLGSVEHVRPGLVRLKRFSLVDPETDAVVLSCEGVDAETQSIQSQNTGRARPVLILTTPAARIDAGGADGLVDIVSRLLQGRRPTDETDIHIDAGSLTVQSGEQSRTLLGFSAQLESLRDGVVATVTFRPAGAPTDASPINVRLVRNRATRPPAFGFDLDTSGGALSCSTLAMVLPSLEILGNRAVLIGRIWGAQTDRRWEIAMRGRLADVDLDRLITDRFPHKLGGMATIDVVTARLSGERLVEGQGTVVAGPGLISRSLVQSLATHMQMPLLGEAATINEIDKYGRLAFQWRLQGEELALLPHQDVIAAAQNGVIPPTAASAVLFGQGELPILAAPKQVHPTTDIVRTLVPVSSVEVPASKETDFLIRHLPIPSVMTDDDATVPQARLRMHTTPN